MWRTAMARATGAIRLQLTEITTTPFHRTYSPSAVINSMILRSLKEHYTEVSKMAPPPVRSHLNPSLSRVLRGLIFKIIIKNDKLLSAAFYQTPGRHCKIVLIGHKKLDFVVRVLVRFMSICLSRVLPGFMLKIQLISISYSLRHFIEHLAGTVILCLLGKKLDFVYRVLVGFMFHPFL
ncbi:hypothetical protein HanIR_Chr07g0325021 [Helianthus annuus]|nr:hypothetical protein HanIR_Chr07g0325021 [Helianthus annuus]